MSWAPLCGAKNDNPKCSDPRSESILIRSEYRCTVQIDFCTVPTGLYCAYFWSTFRYRGQIKNWSVKGWEEAHRLEFAQFAMSCSKSCECVCPFTMLNMPPQHNAKCAEAIIYMDIHSSYLIYALLSDIIWAYAKKKNMAKWNIPEKSIKNAAQKR